MSGHRPFSVLTEVFSSTRKARIDEKIAALDAVLRRDAPSPPQDGPGEPRFDKITPLNEE